MADHPDKHIRQAVRYAKSQGWIVEKAGGRAHIWGLELRIDDERTQIHPDSGHGTQ